MDHRYIDEFSVAQRYVDNALPPEERVAFEAHLVDCQECTDRLLLAGMFHARQTNGTAYRPGLFVRLKPRQLVLILLIAVLLLAIPALVILMVVR